MTDIEIMMSRRRSRQEAKAGETNIVRSQQSHERTFIGLHLHGESAPLGNFLSVLSIQAAGYPIRGKPMQLTRDQSDRDGRMR
jgi:hypothetical protein